MASRRRQLHCRIFLWFKADQQKRLEGEVQLQPGDSRLGVFEMRPIEPSLEPYTYNGEILIESNSGQVTIPLRGEFFDSAAVIFPQIRIIPDEIHFGSGVVDSNEEQEVKIENLGFRTLTISEISIIASNNQSTAFS